MRFDINETLLRHIATGGGAAAVLRQEVADHAERGQGSLGELAALLFDARSDIRRLQRAEDVSRAILHVNDFADILELRKIVARQELSRLIEYAKQKDHTAHTVYLYFLGIWFFDSIPAVRRAVANYAHTRTDVETSHWFLFQWLFASLLHDIGYAFYDLSQRTRPDRKLIDEIYSWPWLEAILRPRQGQRPVGRRERLGSMALEALRQSHQLWTEQYGNAMPTGTADCKDSSAILNRLAAAPWLVDLNPDWRRWDIFDVLEGVKRAKKGLRAYATAVADNGYSSGGSAGCVDHAVASGLLLFQYTSYWYWLMNDLKRRSPELYREATDGHDYGLDKIKGTVVNACRAAAYHNLQPSVPVGSTLLDAISLESHPILFLAVVCDELQSWDRAPSGPSLLKDFKESALSSLEGEDIELTCTGPDSTRAILRISHPKQNELVERMLGALASRIPSYDRIVDVRGA